MFKIYTLSTNETVGFAAHELRKYLRMMMPDCGDIRIAHDPAAQDGFRLGLMQELGLDTSDVKDTELDDILYIDTDEKGGVIAGDNPRSVLLAVYEFLRQNGCRWLMPGPDGEYIPMKDVEAVSYRHAPSCRYRGWGTATAHEQTQMMEYVDFAPKIGMNLAMIEFFVPLGYYNDYYRHKWNEEKRPAEVVTAANVLQWKRQLEAEISLRGLQYHDVGHGFIADAFGVAENESDPAEQYNKVIPPENYHYVAELNGERKLFKNLSVYTQFCMSQAKARSIFADSVVRYAEKHQNVDFLHVWLADGSFNHCECAECQKKRPSDWYIMAMNEIDERLTAKGLSTRIVFIAYTDTMWAPETERLSNPDRFTLCFAPITRYYSYTLRSPDMPKAKMAEYRRNQNANDRAQDLDEHFLYLDEWKKVFPGSIVGFEYHSWSPYPYDPAGIYLAKRVWEDVKVYKDFDVDGLIQDGSQRHFFPHGLVVYTYARTMYDTSLSFEEIAEDYFKTAYGEDWRKFYDVLEKIVRAMPYSYLAFVNSYRRESRYYAPKMEKTLRSVRPICEECLSLIREHYTSPVRLQTVSMRLLEKAMEMTPLVAEAFAEKSIGNDERAKELFHEMRLEMGKWESGHERYYDHFHYMSSYMYPLFYETPENKEALTATEAMYADY